MSKNTKIVIVSIIFICASIVLFTLASLRASNDNTDGEYLAPNVPAFLVYDNNSYSVTNDPISEEFLKSDLALFARTNYPQYSVDNRIPVEFIIDKTPIGANEKIVLSGKFKKTKNNVTVNVELLKNSRIKLSITDDVTNTNMDNELVSNSAENQFIGTLPLNEKDYNISYESPDIVSVNAYFRDPTILEEARAKINSIVGENTMKQLNISISYPTPGFMDE